MMHMLLRPAGAQLTHQLFASLLRPAGPKEVLQHLGSVLFAQICNTQVRAPNLCLALRPARAQKRQSNMWPRL